MRATALRFNDTVVGEDGFEYILTPVEVLQALTDEMLEPDLVWVSRSDGTGQLEWLSLDPDSQVKAIGD
jgi:hypothetical protein